VQVRNGTTRRPLMDERVLEAPPPHRDTIECGHECDMVPQEGTREGERILEVLLQGPDKAQTRARVTDAIGHDIGRRERRVHGGRTRVADAL